jgi:hypothetical protein
MVRAPNGKVLGRQNAMADPRTVIDEFEVENVDPSTLQSEIDDVIVKLKQRGVDELKDIGPGDFAVEKTGHGVGLIETMVAAFAGALAKEAAVTAWQKLIWPSLEQRLGRKIKRKPPAAPQHEKPA